MGEFFLQLKAKRDDAFFRVLSVSPAAEASAILRSAGLHENDFTVEAVSPAAVSKYLSRARIGISFRKPTFSQIAASPTKISEYLAAGLPVVSNAGTGDIDELLVGEQVGVTVNRFDRTSYQTAVDRILELAAEENIRTRCREAALSNFDLVSIGRARYHEVYKRLEDA
jgi:glycosyltransferase involved in cell wall biosynthesis